MYSEGDLHDAVAAGAISAEAAQSLRDHVSAARAAPVTDEESFRLVTGFNDIFVTIAAVLLLLAMGSLGQALTPRSVEPPPFAGLFVAGAAWLLAEQFTRKRGMALPSIVLLVAFVAGIFTMLFGVIAALVEASGPAQPDDTVFLPLLAGAALLTAGAAWLHWRRFKVPITVAAGAAALVGAVIALFLSVIGPARGVETGTILMPLVFVAGLAVFAYAMRWDMGDRARETRRADVAFWLHLLAAPMIAHPLFNWLGVLDGVDRGLLTAVGVLATYLALALVALVVDRRALLVSALAYVLTALTWLFNAFGAVEFSVALTALVIGSALLTLSAFWTSIRSALLEKLPGAWQARLPRPGAVPHLAGEAPA